MPRKPKDESQKSPQAAAGSSYDSVPVRLDAERYRLVRTVSNWKGVSLIDYLGELVDRGIVADLEAMAKDLNRVVERRKE